MLKYLEQLRKKSLPERRKAVLTLSLLITGLIAIIWIVVTVIRIETTDFSFRDDSPFKDSPGISETFKNFGDIVNRVVNSDVQVVPDTLSTTTGESLGQ